MLPILCNIIYLSALCTFYAWLMLTIVMMLVVVVWQKWC